MQLLPLLAPLSNQEQNEILELVQFKADKDEHFLWTPTSNMAQLIERLWQHTDIIPEQRTTPDNELLNTWFRSQLDAIDP